MLWEIIEYSCTTAFVEERVQLYVGAILTGILKRVQNTNELEKKRMMRNKHITVNERNYLKVVKNEVVRVFYF